MASNSAAPQQQMDDESKLGVNLHRKYARLNESLTTLFDGLGVRRSFTVPYVHGQDQAAHIKAVGQTAVDAGGLANNLVTTAHHSGGRGWGSGDGATVGYSAPKLREVAIPAKNADAKAAIDAAQAFLTAVHSLLGDDPAVVQAQAQLDLVKQHDASGMNLMDFGVLAQQIVAGPLKAVARGHAGKKQDTHSPKPMPPRHGMTASPDDDDEQPAQQTPAGPQQAPPAAAPVAPAPQAQ